MKLLGQNLHLMSQNKLNMTAPPTNEKDFASLIEQHSGIINKVSYFYATDKLPFDDIRQEIYVNIWLGLKQIRGNSKISTWIYRVAVNSALMPCARLNQQSILCHLISACLTFHPSLMIRKRESSSFAFAD